LLLIGDWIGGWGMQRGFQTLSLVLASAVQAGVGWRFYRGAWRQARVGRSNMDTLVSLGSSSAYLWSLWLFFTQSHAHLFFAESVSILTLISVGHALEARMSSKAGNALRALMELAPTTARRLDSAGHEVETPVAQLRTGERLRIKPGDQIPVDAIVLEGDSSADESLLTGEPMPVSKTSGSALLAGSANVEGSLIVRVTATGEHTSLARIAAVVERAQSSRASIQRLADRVSSVFVPVVVMIACVAAAAWAWTPETLRHWQSFLSPLLWHPQASLSPMSDAVSAFCSVLIVACPCAMGMATPVDQMAGINANLFQPTAVVAKVLPHSRKKSWVAVEQLIGIGNIGGHTAALACHRIDQKAQGDILKLVGQDVIPKTTGIAHQIVISHRTGDHKGHSKILSISPKSVSPKS
jgi:Cu+-exporting ATPase